MLSNVHEILRAEDIEGLLALGAPADEYVSEAQQISAAIAKLPVSERTEESVAATIALIWAASFDLSPVELEKRVPAIRQTARRLIGLP